MFPAAKETRSLPRVIKYATLTDEPMVVGHQFFSASMEEALATDGMTDAAEEAEQLKQEIINVATQKAAVIVADAQSEAVREVLAAQEQTEALKQQACEEGRQQGVAEGKEQVLLEMRQQVHEAAVKAEKILALADQEAKNMILAAERQIVDIAISLARKVLACEVEENPVVILPVVKAALEKVRDQEHITLRVSSEDMAIVLEARRDLLIMIGSEHALTIKTDQTVTPGGCVIDTDYGSVDARLDMQFEALSKALREVSL